MAKGRPSKRDHIIRIATDLFLENGFKATSIDIVVSRTGVSKPTVYNNFPDKKHLLTAIVQDQIHFLLEKWSEIINKVQDNTPETVISCYQHFLKNERLIQLYRLMIGEGYRFPELLEQFRNDLDVTIEKSVRDRLSTMPEETTRVIIDAVKGNILWSSLLQNKTEEMERQNDQTMLSLSPFLLFDRI
jgi:TetR/AcrR family transcriptional regulator, regulator of autoinduction and epiphytic fitness